MKKYIIFQLVLHFVILNASAQAPVVDAGWLPQAGESIIRNNKVTTLYTLNPKDTGENVVWDFSYASYSPGYVSEINTPTVKGVNCGNPNSNLAIGSDSFVYDCYYVDSSGFYYTGHYQITDGDTWDIVYTDPSILIKSNFVFRDTYRDTVEYWTKFRDRDSFRRGTESIMLRYDGYGTLKIADKVYDSTIRIHTTRLLVDSSYYVSDSGYRVSRLYEDNFSWYRQGFHRHVLTAYFQYYIEWNGTSYDTTKLVRGPGDDGGFYFLNLPDTLSGGSSSSLAPPLTDEISATINGGALNIFYEGSEDNDMKYNLYDIGGKQITGGRVQVAGKTTVNLPRISEGIYILKVQDSSGNEKNIKLIKK